MVIVKVTCDSSYPQQILFDTKIAFFCRDGLNIFSILEYNSISSLQFWNISQFLYMFCAFFQFSEKILVIYSYLSVPVRVISARF